MGLGVTYIMEKEKINEIKALIEKAVKELKVAEEDLATGERAGIDLKAQRKEVEELKRSIRLLRLAYGK